MKIEFPQEVIQIMQKLEDNGFEAFVVGGAVRDFIFGYKVKDIDINTSAEPEEIINVFKNYKRVEYGLKHGTVGIIINRKVYEITTFREEDIYSDGRRPDSVKFIKNLRTDLGRRDFTINAMAANKEGKIIDIFAGMDDINNKLIRTVGMPIDRFKEDSLRMLRAVRFALRYGFEIESFTKKAIQSNAHLIHNHMISGERILLELKEILLHDDKAVKLLHDLNLFQVIFPEIKEDTFVKLYKIIKGYTLNSLNIIIAVVIFLFQKQEPSFELRDLGDIIFKKLPGLGSYREEYILTLVKFLPIPFYVKTNLYRMKILRWVLSWEKYLKRKSDFKRDRFFSDLLILDKMVNNSWYKKNMKIQDDIKKIYAQIKHIYPKNIPVNGFEARDCGYDKISIKWILKIWMDEFLANPDHPKDYYFELARTIKQDFTVDEKDIIDRLNEKQEISDPISLEFLQEYLSNIIFIHLKFKTKLVINLNTHISFDKSLDKHIEILEKSEKKKIRKENKFIRIYYKQT